MAKSTPIKGRDLVFQIDGVDHYCDIRQAVMTSEDRSSDDMTFCDTAGDRQHFFNVTANQSTASGSFWRMIWENTGEEVPFVFAPHGNLTASEDEPHFTGTVTIGPKPDLGGQAGRQNTYSFEARFDIDGVPDLVTTGSELPERTTSPAGRMTMAAEKPTATTTAKTATKTTSKDA